MTRLAVVRRTLTATLVVPLALAVLTGCGNNSSDPNASDTSSSGSVSSGSDSPAPADPPNTGASIAPADLTDLLAASFADITTARTTLESGVMGTMTGEGEIDYTVDPPSASMTLTGDAFGEDKVETILVDNVMYLNLGSMTGDKYAKVDLDDPNNPFGESFADSMDPQSALRTLGDALVSATYVGEEDVDGVSLRHYAAKVDTAKLLDSSGQEVPESAGMPDTLSYDIWFDDQGRFTRMSIDLAALGSTTLALSDWGTEVDIQVPDASEITQDSPFSGVPSNPAG